MSTLRHRSAISDGGVQVPSAAPCSRPLAEVGPGGHTAHRTGRRHWPGGDRQTWCAVAVLQPTALQGREELGRLLQTLRHLLGRGVRCGEDDGGFDGEGAHRLGDGHSAHGGGPAAGEGHAVRGPAALHVEVDATHLGGERVDERRRGVHVLREDGRLLAVPARLDRGVHLGDVRVPGDGDDGAELLLLEDAHGRRHAVEERGHKEGPGEAAAALVRVGELGALGERVADELLEVGGLCRLWERGDGRTVPGEAGLELGDLLPELGDEEVGDGVVDHHELDGGAALAVVARRAEHALLDRGLEVSIGQHDADVLARELREHLEAVGLGVLLDELVHGASATDEANHVHEARLHDGRHGLAARAGHKVNHAWRQHVGERVRGEKVHEAADGGDLEDAGVAHEEAGDQHGVHLVERIVEGREAEHDADGSATDLAPHARHLLELLEAHREGGVRAERLDHSGDEVRGAVKLLGGVAGVFADLPHEHVDDFLANLAKLDDELLNGGDAVGERHLRPGALAAVPGGSGSIDSGDGLLLVELRELANLRPLAGRLVHNGRSDVDRVAGEGKALAADELEDAVDHGLLGVHGRVVTDGARREGWASERLGGHFCDEED
mmetsp:Transcript_26691/g.78597  ORF Transcript_26691/g.78597 Transcript_26691/m.78597 type:complete len:612 (+) Transcript_26691:143-1978(+)